MKNIVLYKSKYGNTLQYATWIAEELNWELRDFSEFKKEEIGNYQNIIFGTAVYMGKMNQIKKALEWFKDKPIIIFACAGNNNDPAEIDRIRKTNFNDEQLAFHRFFYLAGGVDFTKVTGIYKKMLAVFRRIMEQKKNKTPDEEAILQRFYSPTNFVDKKEIAKIVAYAKSV